jgi:hypothetical protein
MNYFDKDGINLQAIKAALPVDDECCLNAIQFFSQAFFDQGVSLSIINNTIATAIDAYVVADEAKVAPAQPVELEILQYDSNGYIQDSFSVTASIDKIQAVVDSAAHLSACLRDRAPYGDAALQLDCALVEASVLKPRLLLVA